jgi:hypothetical protein
VELEEHIQEALPAVELHHQMEVLVALLAVQVVHTVVPVEQRVRLALQLLAVAHRAEKERTLLVVVPMNWLQLDLIEAFNFILKLSVLIV